MKNEKLEEAFGLIKDDYIEHAHSQRRFRFNFQRKHVLRIVGVAACVIALLIILPQTGVSKTSGLLRMFSSSIACVDDQIVKVEDNSEPETIRYDDMTAVSSASDSVTDIENKTSGKKIIVTGTLKLQCSDIDAAGKTIMNLCDRYGGYSASLDDYSETYGSVLRHYFKATIRVPKDSFSAFVEEVKAQGGVLSYSENCNDVTDTYTDYSARLQVLNAEKERVLTYFEKSNSVGELIEVETRLSELQQEIESIQAKLNYYDSVVDYSTLYLTLVVTTYEQTSPLSFGERFVQSFKDGWNSFTTVLGELVLFIVFNIWWLIILGGAVGMIVLRYRKKHGIVKKTFLKDNSENSKG